MRRALQILALLIGLLAAGCSTTRPTGEPPQATLALTPPPMVYADVESSPLVSLQESERPSLPNPPSSPAN